MRETKETKPDKPEVLEEEIVALRIKVKDKSGRKALAIATKDAQANCWNH